jgi:CubicO group peptidase (beta-lactamase class C family)
MSPFLDQLITTAIAERIFPGAVVLAARSDAVLFHNAYGTTMYGDEGSVAVGSDTLYDIASLTKVFTATAALHLCAAGLLDLDGEARHYLPTLQAKGVTLRHLLTHTSGLELRLSLLREQGPDGIRRAIYATVPRRAPGTYLAYTNIGATIMGDVVAVAYGGPLDQAIAELITEPLGMHETRFNPPGAWRERIAPTEWDDEWRKGLVHGVVHDESAYALGGVAGHAGLFSTASDLLRFGRWWLAELPPIFAAATSDYTWGLPSPTGQLFRMGLGWMLDREGFMGPLPAGTMGHTGFTGPIIVVCPARNSCVIMLCNRTYPGRTPPPYRHHGVMAKVCEGISYSPG